MEDVSLVVKVKDKSVDDGVFVAWDEDETCFFKLAYVGKSTIALARKASTTQKLDRKTHRFIDDVDDDKFDKELMCRSILDWKGLKYKHLAEILDPNRVDVEVKESQAEVEIPFSEETRDIIATYYNLSFSRFASGVSFEIDTYQQMKKEELIKNSKTSQVGTL
jgi:hypothetical protein